jgi:endoglucanase
MLTAGAATADPAQWNDFKTRFIQADGRVVDTGNHGISHSEGQGFSMIMAVANNDRATFDKLWTWTDRNLSRPDVRLFAWRFDPAAANPVSDQNNATDGDLMIAWALMRAQTRWGAADYGRTSLQIRQAILGRLAVKQGDRTLLAPGMTGFVRTDSLTVNPSYAVMPALDAFAAAEPRSTWPLVRDQSLKLLRDAKFGAFNLPSDWVRVDQAGGLWTEPDKPPQFGFDAVRVPLYLCWSGRCNDKALEGPKRYWQMNRGPGRRPPAWVDVGSGAAANFPASAGVDAIAQLVLNRTGPAPGARGEDYYSSALLALTEIAAREGGRRR